MANTTARKTPARVKAAAMETETSVVGEEPKPKKFANDEGVPCRSITSGPLYMTGIKSKVNYKWADLNDVTEVEYQDLVAAIRSNSSYITKPYFVIDDQDFLTLYPQVAKLYQSLYSVKDLQDIFTLSPAAMKTAIQSLPVGAQETVKTLAAQMIRSGQLDSIKKIAALDEIYGTKLMMMTELFNA